MHRYRIFFICLSVLICLSATAQKGMLKQANKYFEAEKYHDALEIYNKFDDAKLGKANLFRRGVSNFYTKNSNEAIKDLTNARSMGYSEKEIYYYAALVLHSKLMFKEASRFYKNYLRYVEDETEKQRIINIIKRCKFGLDNKYNEQIAFVENLGPSFNTEYDEINPVQSPTSQNKYYFSSNRAGSHGGLRNMQGFKDDIYGKYFADMYAVELVNGNWSPASSFHPILNGPKDDIIQGFNPDGSVMYFLKTQDGVTGQMYSDTFSIDKDPEAFPIPFESPAIAELGDKDLHVFKSNILLFSSRRSGGYGGYDLYVSIKEDGAWGPPINLGPKINSKFNEVAPFLTQSGRKLYFSTDRIESFGGYDVYGIEYMIESQEWSVPKNLGMPINSALDDLGFSVSADGMTAVFSSDRIESTGGSDLYMAYLKEQDTHQLMYTEQLPFIETGDGGNLDLVSISKTEDNQKSIPEEELPNKTFYNSPLFYGSDEIILDPSNTVKINSIRDLMLIYPDLKVTFSGNSPQEGMRELDLYFSIKRAEKVAEYLIKNDISPSRINVKGLGSNFPLVIQNRNQSSSFSDKTNRRIDVTFSNIPEKRLKIIEDRPVVSPSLRDVAYDKYSSTISELAYKIQIAKTKQMFKADVIRQYQSCVVEKNMAEDIYTYTIGVYDAYNQIRGMKNELSQKGLIDARIVPYMNGEPLNFEQILSLREFYSDLNEYLKFESR